MDEASKVKWRWEFSYSVKRKSFFVYIVTATATFNGGMQFFYFFNLKIKQKVRIFSKNNLLNWTVWESLFNGAISWIYFMILLALMTWFEDIQMHSLYITFIWKTLPVVASSENEILLKNFKTWHIFAVISEVFRSRKSNICSRGNLVSSHECKSPAPQ